MSINRYMKPELVGGLLRPEGNAKTEIETDLWHLTLSSKNEGWNEETSGQWQREEGVGMARWLELTKKMFYTTLIASIPLFCYCYTQVNFLIIVWVLFLFLIWKHWWERGEFWSAPPGLVVLSPSRTSHGILQPHWVCISLTAAI